jgi:GAF domain-containing protein
VLARLVTLYNAVERLHAATTTDAVCAVIGTIVAGQIGAAEYAIFEVDRRGAALELIASAGINADLVRQLRLGEGLVGRAAASGRLYIGSFAERDDIAVWEETLSACIPLRYRGRHIGAIAVFGLDADKAEFTPLDLDLFELLSRHAALALTTTRRPGQTEEEGVTP